VGSLREYETVFILRPTLEESRVEEEIEGVRQLILAASGEVLGIERWGRRRLAYEIRRMNEGIYTLIRFKANANIVTDLDRRYRLREDVLRHLTVISQAPPPVEAMQPHEDAAAVPQPDLTGGEAEEVATGAAISDPTPSSGESSTEAVQADPEVGSQQP
jgi:small subunit ribosomal protein S6